MDDFTKKVFVQLDDDMPGVRGNATESLYAHNKKTGQSVRGYIPQIERGEQYDALEQETIALRQQNAGLQSDLANDRAELAQYKVAIGKWRIAYAAVSAIAWGRATGPKLAAYIAVPLIAVGIWQGTVRYWPLPAPVDAGLREIAATTSWSEGCGNAVVHEVGRAPYWVLLCGRTDTTSHLNAQGQSIGLHCLDLYATTAEADWQEYIKADPYALFGWWINWPKRAVHCEPFEIKEAQR